MRPKTIVYFELIIFGTLLLGASQSYFAWHRAIALGALTDREFVADLLITIFLFVLVATLTLFVSRRRSKIALWVLIALFAVSLPFVVQMMMRGELLGSNIIAVLGSVGYDLQGIGQAVAYGLLFTPSARRWMNREDEKLRDVFA